jgi:hypothetical protein
MKREQSLREVQQQGGNEQLVSIVLPTSVFSPGGLKYLQQACPTGPCGEYKRL